MLQSPATAGQATRTRNRLGFAVIYQKVAPGRASCSRRPSVDRRRSGLGAASFSASCFRYDFGLLLAKVQATVGAEDARPDLIARPEVLRPPAL